MKAILKYPNGSSKETESYEALRTWLEAVLEEDDQCLLGFRIEVKIHGSLSIETLPDEEMTAEKLLLTVGSIERMEKEAEETPSSYLDNIPSRI